MPSSFSVNKGKISDFIKHTFYLNTHMNLTDNNHLEIENCKQILEYNNIRVKLQTSNMIVSVWGSNLSVEDYNMDGIVINGEFSSLEFEKIQGVKNA
ncbi:MAG: YabP/YqfC family sporulation protein [Ruminococcus sp.]|jgi:sporulation protein YqfC|nr:YabP/YqfC family sporulation protein [Ruminococcus sp.]